MLGNRRRAGRWARAAGEADVCHRGGVPWDAAPIPPRWHTCRPQTVELHRERSVLTGTCRCSCGAVTDHTGAWQHRNARRNTDPAGLRHARTSQPGRTRAVVGTTPSPRCPPPPAFPAGRVGMSEALDRVRDLCRAGFGCLPLYDQHGKMDAVQVTRVRAGHIETVLIWGEHDALAARCRDDEHAAVVWHQAGTTADVIAALLDLPAPGTRSAPVLARTAPTDLWLPPGCGP